MAPLVSKKIRRKLRPVFQTRVDRVTRPVHVGQSEIELAVDRGKLSAGRQSEPIAELELELKNGRAVDLFRIAKILERRAGAELDLQSKAERGYQLANGNNHGVAVRAEPVQLTKRMTANEAFTVIALSSLRHFSANAGGLRELDPEAIHQMRVGLRRLRAAISLFGEILPAVATAKINAELKWLTTSLAPAREIDVFVKEKITPLERRTEPRRGVRAIESQFSARRTQAFHDARDALGMPRYRALLINVLEWLETRKPNDPDEAGKSIVGFAAGIMHRRLSKARKEGRRLSDLSAHKRHKLRIKIKKIRYAVDFFRSLYPHKAEADLALQLLL